MTRPPSGFAWGGVVLASLVLALPAGAAEPPRVEFDLAHAVACSEATSDDFAALHPEEKVVQAVFRVSVRLTAGREADVEELLFEITSPEQRLRVLDFDPETTLESEVVGPVKVTKTTEKINSLGASIGGNVAAPLGPAKATLTPAANAGETERDVLVETSKKIAPKQAVLTSGTLHQGHGVFFKLHRSLETSFEGSHEFACRMIVPHDWTGDWVLVSCQARGEQKRYFVKSTVPCGQTTAFVGLYLAGEPQARAAAFRLAHAQGRSATTVGAPRSSPDPLTFALTHWMHGGVSREAAEASRTLTPEERLVAARRTLGRFSGQEDGP